jgi:hypothetical protein
MKSEKSKSKFGFAECGNGAEFNQMDKLVVLNSFSIVMKIMPS